MKKLIILTLITITALSITAFASEHFDEEKSCVETTQYYAPSLSDIEDADISYEVIDCLIENTDHHNFPGTHTSPINLADEAQADKDSHQSYTEHTHTYINTAVKTNKNGENIFYETNIKKFELKLQEDALNNIDLNSVQCELLPDGNNCNSADYYDCDGCGINVDANGYFIPNQAEFIENNILTKVTFNKITGKITWYFPGIEKDPSYQRFVVYGKNGEIWDSVPGFPDTSIANNRKFILDINFQTNDKAPEEAWSATVTSRFLVLDLFATLNENTIPSVANINWGPLQDDYYWFAGGTSTTIWERAPEEQALCSELNIVPTNLEANEAGEITITVKDTDGANLPGNTIINVVNTAGGTLTNKNDAEVINTTKINKFPLNYSGGEDGTIIFTIDNSSEYYSASCTDSVQVGEAVCSALLVDHYDPVYEDVVSTFAAQAKDGIFFMDDKIDYSVIPPVAPGEDVEYGYFYTSKPANSELTQDVSNAEYIKEIILDFYWSSLSLILDYYPLLDLELGASLNKNLLLGLATGFDMAEGGTFKVDESLKAPSKEDILMTETDLLKVDPGIFKVDPGIFEEDPDLISVIEIPEISKWFLLANQVEADPVETVYFLGEKPGEQVVEIQPVDNSEAVCLRKFDVEPLCKELQVNYEGDETSALEADVQHELIYENRLTHFEASGLTWKDDDFSGRITYSVDSGYGTFYTYKPAGKILNSTMDNVATVQEFNASGIDISYYDQLCEDPEKPTFGKSKTTVFEKGVPDFLKNIYFEDNNFKFEDAIVPKTGTKPAPKIDYSIIKIMDDYKFIKMEDYKNLKIDPLPPITKAPDSKSLQASLITLIPDPNPIIINEDLILDPGFGSEGQSGNMITVDPGQKVWFFAEKEGDDVIHVSANCANSETCVRHFDIIAFPVCGELTLNKVNFEANEAGEISIDSLEDINGNSIDETVEINVTKTATGELTDKNNVVINDGDTITTDQFPVNYAGGESGEITFTIDSGSEYYSESCSASIEVGVVAVCNSLEVEPPSFEANDAGNISITVKDENNDNLAADTIIDIANTADGTLTGADSAEVTNTATISQFPLSYSGGESGEITFTIDNTSEYYSASCTDSIAIGVSQSCESLALTITEHNGAGVTKLTNNKVYFVNANASFSSEASAEDQEVTLTMNSSFGAFIEAADLENAATAASNMADDGTLNDATINNAPGLTTTNTITLTGDNTDQVLLVTYNNSADMASALSAYVTNFQEDCSQTVEYDGVEEPPPTEETKCTDLTIKKPDSPWDKTYNSIINYEIFEIEVETDQAEKEDEIEITWEVTNGDAEWHKLIGDSEGKSKDTTNGKYSYYLKNISEVTKIEIYATDFKEECSDSIEYKKPENPEAPEFQKLVYKNNPSDAKSILNLSSADASSSTITFFVEFKPGTGTEIVEIRDKKIDSYEELTATDNIDIKIDNTTDYEEDDCEDKDGICVENKDDFKNGNPITFYNIGEAEKITITYEMSLAVALDCDNIEPEDGCGKIFENKAEYVAKDNEGNKLYEGSDSAKVIVICPYILTRSGSDAFFYDLPSTGVDVARCSEVKGCVGVCITPDPVKPEPGTPKTGSGEIIEDEIQLSLPTHDICTFSNDPKNIQGYNDVLENFSSTICEVQTAVAEEWQETHINSAITANIERIARWGENLSGKDTHQAKPTSANGVFVKDGDKDNQPTYTIGNATKPNGEANNTIIKGDSNTPAAQTYIIQNADLIINNNIVYGATDFTDPNKIPSVAFIVIDGNIEIAANVSKLHGIYMAIDTNNEDNDGQIISSGGRSTTKLTIYGNLFGNVNELFKNRIGIGDPLKDEGSVTIRYDERIILNTPPGISELIDIQQAIVPN